MGENFSLNFLKELDSIREIRFLKWRYVINSNSWFLAISKGFSEGLRLFKLMFFSYEIKKDFKFNYNRYFMSQSLTSNARTTHPLSSVWHKLWENLIFEWPLKQTGLVFA